MKKILFVVDERMMGGVSVILENIINSFKNINFDILVLHDRGNELNNLNNAKLIFGTPFFEVADLKMSEIIKSMNIKLFLESKYLNCKHYD